MAVSLRLQYPGGQDLLTLLQSAGMCAITDPAAYELLQEQCESYVSSSVDEWEQETGYQPFLVPGVPILGASNATPIVLNIPAHGWSTGQGVTVLGMQGNTAGNGFWTVTVTDGNNISLNGSVGNGLYTRGAVAQPDTTRYYTPQGPERGQSQAQYRTTFGRGGSSLLETDNGFVSVTQVTTGIGYDPSGNEINGTVRTLHTEYDLYPENALAGRSPYEWLEFSFPLYGTRRSVKVTGRFGFCDNLSENVWRAILGNGAHWMQAEAQLLVTGGQARYKLDSVLEVQFPVDALTTHFKPWRDRFLTVAGKYDRPTF